MEIKIHNVMEDIIEGKTEKIMRQMGCCTCEYCQSDVAAYVLNHVDSKYVSTARGELFAKSIEFDSNFDMQLIILISTAVKKIMEHPHHVDHEKKN